MIYCLWNVKMWAKSMYNIRMHTHNTHAKLTSSPSTITHKFQEHDGIQTIVIAYAGLRVLAACMTTKEPIWRTSQCGIWWAASAHNTPSCISSYSMSHEYTLAHTHILSLHRVKGTDDQRHVSAKWKQNGFRLNNVLGCPQWNMYMEPEPFQDY